jgi:hypothetical protein
VLSDDLGDAGLDAGGVRDIGVVGCHLGGSERHGGESC